MPFAISPAVPAGSLSSAAQPSIPSRDGRLLLRPWEADDAPVLQSAFEDPLIRRWHTRYVASAEEAQEWIADFDRFWQEEQAAQWAITHAASGEIFGRMALRWMDLLHGVAECGYWVLSNARGTGVAPHSLSVVADWALNEAGFHRVELAHSVVNDASCRVAIKSGFALEGTRRSAHLHTDGWHDMHLHARIQSDA